MKENKEHEAYKIAMRYHADQMYGDKPYEVHLQAVRDVLVEFGYIQEDLLCAAWLHDIIEDTDCPVKLLADRFGPEVVNLVWAVTGFGVNRKARAEDAYRKMQHEPRAVILKCADRIANMRASIGSDKEQMYLKAWPDFSTKLVSGMPIAMFDALFKLHNRNVPESMAGLVDKGGSDAEGQDITGRLG